MTSRFARLGAAFVLALTVSLVTACAGTTPPPEPTTTPSAARTPSAPAVEPSAEPTEEPVAIEDPTCDTLISETIVADYESIGWTARADPFYAGELEIPEGLLCVWADFAGPAGDHLQMFGWAPITADVAAAAQSSLVNQGWVRESGPDGVYITENPETTIATDDQGYGMTYLFGDGWVIVSDTKQGLVLIEWPPA